MESGKTYPNAYFRASWVFGPATLVGGLVCALTYGSQSAVALVLSTVLTTLAFIGWIVCAITGWGLEKHLRFFREGKALARWEVTGQQWLDHARKKRRKLDLAQWAVLGLLVLFVVLAFAVLPGQAEAGGFIASMLAPIALAFVAFIRLVIRRPYAPGVHRAKIELGPGIAFINGHLLSFAGFGQRITSVELDREHLVIVIRGRTISHESDMPYEHTIPYPAEAEEEARKAVLGLGLTHGLSPAPPD